MNSNSTKKPNILFLLFDHQLFYRHGWDQEPVIQRPNYDALCAQGVHFDNAYCASPLCGPARRSMLTGVRPHRHGETRNDIEMPWQGDSYLNILNREGYHCTYYGKWHAGPGSAHEHGCEGFSYPSYNNPYTKQEYLAYLAKFQLPIPEIKVEHNFWGNATPGDIIRQTGDWCNEHYSGIMQTPKETHEAFFLAHLACKKLKSLAGQPSEPFHLRVDFWGPHQPYFPTQEYADLYPPEEIPVYGNFHDDLTRKPAVYMTEGNNHISKDNKLIQPNPLPWRDWQEVLSRAYAQQTLCDEAAGLILKTLRETGLDENTIVIWSADHGDALACHGGHFDKRSYLPEEVLRIPMAMAYPGVLPEGKRSFRIVSNVDIPVTILAAAGTGFDTSVDGRNMLEAADDTIPWDNYTVCETHGHGEDVIGRALPCGRYKYICTVGQMRELYDLEKDPYELDNLALDMAYEELISEMHEMLLEECRRSGDTGFITAYQNDISDISKISAFIDMP